MAAFSLETLVQIIRARACLPEAEQQLSYTQTLLQKGHVFCARKFGEEALELIIAAAQGSEKEILYEAADVLYHLLVLLNVCGVSYEEILKELERRTACSGLAEKAARSQSHSSE